MRTLIVLCVALSACTTPAPTFDAEGVGIEDPTLECDLMVYGRCEYFSRTSPFIPPSVEVKP